MKNFFLSNTFLYSAIAVLLCASNLTMHGMELQTTTRQSRHTHEIVAVELEAGRHDGSTLNAELIKHIKDGNVVHLNQFFTMRTHDESCLASALKYTQDELALQQDQRAQKTCDRFFTRYKPVIFPAFIIAFSVVNLTLSVLSYSQLQQAPSNIDIASLSINVAGSVLPGIVYSGYEKIKHIRSGWLDSTQKDKVAQLNKSQVILQLLYDIKVKDETE